MQWLAVSPLDSVGHYPSNSFTRVGGEGDGLGSVKASSTLHLASRLGDEVSARVAQFHSGLEQLRLLSLRQRREDWSLERDHLGVDVSVVGEEQQRVVGIERVPPFFPSARRLVRVCWLDEEGLEIFHLLLAEGFLTNGPRVPRLRSGRTGPNQLGQYRFPALRECDRDCC